MVVEDTWSHEGRSNVGYILELVYWRCHWMLAVLNNEVVSGWAHGDDICGVKSEYPVKYIIHRKCRFAVKFTAMVNEK